METETFSPINEPRQVVIAGDTHGDMNWWRTHILPLAKRAGAVCIVQVGDFGVWPGGEKYLDNLDAALEELGMWVLFLDGNHEDFPQIESFPIREDGFREMRKRIIHAPRGSRWEWYGKRWMAVGGAVSIDRGSRQAWVSWWPQERITYAEAMKAMEGGEVDVLLTHDVPTMIRFEGASIDIEAYENRRMLDEICEAVKPKVIVHGHWHVGHRTRGEYEGGEALVVGLHRNQYSGNMVAVDAAAIEREEPWTVALPTIDSGPTKVSDEVGRIKLARHRVKPRRLPEDRIVVEGMDELDSRSMISAMMKAAREKATRESEAAMEEGPGLMDDLPGVEVLDKEL